MPPSRLSPRFISLISLTFNYTALTILMHVSRTRVDPSLPRYKASSAVVLTEVGKLLVSLFLGVKEVSRADERVRWDRESAKSPSTVLHGMGYADAKGGERDSPPTMLRPGNPVGARRPSGMREKQAVLEGGGHGHSSSVDLPSLVSSPLEGSRDGRAYERDDVGEAAVRDELAYRFRRLFQEVFASDWYKLGIPAGLFTLQSTLQYTAIANLSVPAFQITSQLKILTTALCSVFLLKRSLTSLQWASLGLLALGVAAVQLNADPATHAATDATTETVKAVTRPPMNRLLGLSAVLLSCLSSGFASTYFELQLKKDAPVSRSIDSKRPPAPPAPRTGLWVRNVQLSLFAFAIGFASFLFESNKEAWAAAASSGPAQPGVGASWWSSLPPMQSLSSLSTSFFVGFTPLVYLVVFLQILGGLLAALVIKFADNIAKNFSTSFSILLSFAASVLFFDFQLGFGAILGGALVVGSTFLFNSTQSDRNWAYGVVTRRGEVANGAAKSPRPDRIDFAGPSAR